MAYDPYPGSGIRTWHVAVFLGVVVIAVDIASIRMLGTNANQFVRVPAPAPQPLAAPPKTETVSLSAPVLGPEASFIVPGCKVDVQVSIHTAEGRRTFTVAKNLVLITGQVTVTCQIPPAIAHVSFEAAEKQARVIALAKERGFWVSLKLRREDSKDTPVDLDEVIKFFETAKPVKAPVRELAPAPHAAPPEVAPAPRPVREDR